MLFWTPKLIISYSHFGVPHGLKQTFASKPPEFMLFIIANLSKVQMFYAQPQLTRGKFSAPTEALLKKDVRLVNDYCLNEAGEDQAELEGKVMRTTDINMLADLNT
ncbi:hypothetical protein BTUL_0090g00430 [Botrytis tulipae]|uniref:Uncharacterized protein n=1 Tax=Botrytis tulipae TaxID=87230 RepID=A0A4Z1EPR8_9HELO|nr:hypothetical protein BTUL_0090g00430 [Botrytis tulipae]